MVQPLTGKILLPLLGGSPAVWNTCMVFFQAVLLLGYLYSHLVTKFFPARLQAILHGAVLIVAGLTLPIPIDVGAPGNSPIPWLLRTLLITVGFPFSVVSTSGPLLQKWFSRSGHKHAADPYFLYAASNAGSVIGLLAYPLVMEPLLTRSRQSEVWSWGYWALVPIVIACGVMLVVKSRNAEANPTAATVTSRVVSSSPLTARRRLLWIVLGLVPSSLMLGVTQHISTDIAAVPLLWAIPLLLYLVTFIIAFSRLGTKLNATLLGRFLPLPLIATMALLLAAARQPVGIVIFIHLLTFFVAALMCHTRLADDRPDAAHLTEYYLLMSLGGVLGGAINALAAPVLFNALFEYPLMLGVACLLRPQLGSELRAGSNATTRFVDSASGRWTLAIVGAVLVAALVFAIDYGIDDERLNRLLTRNGLVRFSDFGSRSLRAVIPVVFVLLLLRSGPRAFALAALAGLLTTPFVGKGGSVLYQERTFFGVHRVLTNSTNTWHTLSHGTTLHGLEAWPTPKNLEEKDREKLRVRSMLPTTYYHRTGPMGDVMTMLFATKRLDSVALVGMGAGTLAAYAAPGSTFVFYEIDQAVIKIAKNPEYFLYYTNAAATPGVQIGTVTGDARLRLQEVVLDGAYHLIVLDAFSSDSIPVHLLTREAFEMYLAKLKDDGLIAVHISNRHFDLRPVLARLASEFHLAAFIRNDSEPTDQEKAEGKKDSVWIALARKPEQFGTLVNAPGWKRLDSKPGDPLWTDEYSNVLGVFVWSRNRGN
jgi:hypothetical protein